MDITQTSIKKVSDCFGVTLLTVYRGVHPFEYQSEKRSKLDIVLHVIVPPVLLLTAIGAKLIGPHGVFQVDKQNFLK